MRLIVGLLVCISASLAGTAIAAPDDQATVLALYPTRRGAPATTQFDRTIEQRLMERFGARIDYYAEFMDLARFPQPGYPDALRDFFRNKYAGQRFDVVVATTNAVLEFVIKYRDDLFQGAAIVFEAGPGTQAPPNATGITSDLNFRATLEIAASIQPDTRRVFVLSGASTWDKYYEGIARQQFKDFESRFDVTYLAGPRTDDLLRQVADLPENSIIYFLTFAEDGAGNRYGGIDVLPRVAAVASAPVYVWHSVGMGLGTIGGSMMSGEVSGARLAELTGRVLSGEAAGDIPVTHVDPNVIEFDWRQLQRWGIREARLPAGSVVRFRESSVWEQYGGYILAAVSLMALQTALISGLLLQRASRKRSEQSLRDSQQRYALATTAGAVGVWDWTLGTNNIFVDPELKRLLGYTDTEIANRMDDWARYVHPDDTHAVMAQAQPCIDGHSDSYEVEHRMLHKDGTVRWFLARGTVIGRGDGTPGHLVGTDIDITDRKQAQEAVRESEAALRAFNAEIQHLAGRLIEAQEGERARLARELHDDASQQIAGLAIMISSLRRQINAAAGADALQAEVSSLQQRTLDLAASVRHLSHNLHPGLLQYSGLVSALTTHCADVERQTGLRVSLHADHDFAEMSPEQSLCLYRVAQEALRNTATHAQARRADIRLSRANGHTDLAVGDDGRGFDLAKAGGTSRGLGLLSIHERVRLAGGTVSIVSRLNAGTTVQVRIPVGPASAERQ